MCLLTSSRWPLTLLPKMVISPPSTLVRPMSMLMVVVLPAPLGPGDRASPPRQSQVDIVHRQGVLHIA